MLLHIFSLSSIDDGGKMNEEIEIWKSISGYEGLYEVSSLGRVRSLDRLVDSSQGYKAKRSGRILKLGVNTSGYYHVALSYGGGIVMYRVSRLVAAAFIENPEPIFYNEVNHKDGIKFNNTVGNLE